MILQHQQQIQRNGGTVLAVLGIGGVMVLGASLLALSTRRYVGGEVHHRYRLFRNGNNNNKKEESGSSEQRAAQPEETDDPTISNKEHDTLRDETERLRPFPWEPAVAVAEPPLINDNSIDFDDNDSPQVPAGASSNKSDSSEVSTQVQAHAIPPISQNHSATTITKSTTTIKNDRRDDNTQLEFLASMTFANGFGMRAPSCPCCQ